MWIRFGMNAGGGGVVPAEPCHADGVAEIGADARCVAGRSTIASASRSGMNNAGDSPANASSTSDSIVTTNAAGIVRCM